MEGWMEKVFLEGKFKKEDNFKKYQFEPSLAQCVFYMFFRGLPACLEDNYKSIISFL